MDKESKRIIKVLIGICGLFLSLVLYMSYFEIFQASKVVSNSYNKRQWINEELVLRGTIADRNGNTLAYSEKKNEQQNRIYKYGSLYSHVIGYSLKEYGKAGLEASYNQSLLNMHDNNPILEIRDKISGPSENGNNLILTIDHNLQKYAAQRLKGKKGAIVLMNPKTGEIYAMVSKPDFDPAALKGNWEDIVEDDNSPLLNRATMGLYTPGSVFKLVTAAAALETPDIVEEKFTCEGSINIDGYVLKDYKGIAHGELNLEEAMAKSCNVTFSQIGLQLGEEKLRKTAERLYLNKIIPFDLKTKTSIFPEQSVMTRPELGATAIGQGKVLVTPLNMALITSAIANDGVMMKPILVKEILTPEGRTLRGSKAEVIARPINSMISQQLEDMMVKVVREGTGTNARIKNVKVAGKTGTAENETGKAHAWFVGYAPVEDPKVAVAVILESSGSTGGTAAAPIARDIIITALRNIK
ncbi:MAG: peptidoglycan D,D-transpeptidase FtsI family protein [Bacillota bacterium]